MGAHAVSVPVGQQGLLVWAACTRTDHGHSVSGSMAAQQRHLSCVLLQSIRCLDLWQSLHDHRKPALQVLCSPGLLPLTAMPSPASSFSTALVWACASLQWLNMTKPAIARAMPMLILTVNSLPSPGKHPQSRGLHMHQLPARYSMLSTRPGESKCHAHHGRISAAAWRKHPHRVEGRKAAASRRFWPRR